MWELFLLHPILKKEVTTTILGDICQLHPSQKIFTLLQLLQASHWTG